MCLAIGGDRCIHPDVLSQYLNKRQLREWAVYASIWGLGAERTDISMATQTWHLLQAWVTNDKRTPLDLMPKFVEQETHVTEEAKQGFAALQAAAGRIGSKKG